MQKKTDTGPSSKHKAKRSTESGSSHKAGHHTESRLKRRAKHDAAHGSEQIIIASICYTEVFRKTVLKSMPDQRVTKTQMDVLAVLHVGESLKMSYISDKLSIAREQVTRAVKALKEMGLVSCQRGGEDGRNTTAMLTPAGAEFITKQRKTSHLLIEEYLSSLSDEDREALIECSSKAVEIFKRNGDFPRSSEC